MENNNQEFYDSAKELHVKIQEILEISSKMKSFDWMYSNIHTNSATESKDMESGIIQSCEASFGAGNGKYAHHAIIRTDRGTFRFGSNLNPCNERNFVDFDLKSKELNNAIENLKLAKFWIEEELNSNRNKYVNK